MIDVAQEIDKRFRVSFEDMARRITDQFPMVKPSVSSSFGGEKTENHAHVLNLDCLLTYVTDEEPDIVGISITTEHIDSRIPKIHADVSWGYPSGFVELNVFPSPVDFSSDALETIEKTLPKMYRVLLSAIELGKPKSF